MNPRVSAVEPLDGWRLCLSLRDGRVAVIDASPLLDFPVYRSLRDPARFVRERLNHATVTWPVGLDIGPDTLQLESHRRRA